MADEMEINALIALLAPNDGDPEPAPEPTWTPSSPEPAPEPTSTPERKKRRSGCELVSIMVEDLCLDDEHKVVEEKRDVPDDPKMPYEYILTKHPLTNDVDKPEQFIVPGVYMYLSIPPSRAVRTWGLKKRQYLLNVQELNDEPVVNWWIPEALESTRRLLDACGDTQTVSGDGTLFLKPEHAHDLIEGPQPSTPSSSDGGC